MHGGEEQTKSEGLSCPLIRDPSHRHNSNATRNKYSKSDSDDEDDY